MIKTICHLADIHIRKTPTRNEEYEEVFKNLINSLKTKKPDRIVIVGDLVHDYLDLQGEQLILAHELLNALADIAPVRITRGNHDCRKKNLKRVDSIRAIVKTLSRDDVIYYDKTGFYDDDNVVWVVWHHGDVKNNPWVTKGGKDVLKNKDNAKTYIDLFHDPITGCKSTTGFEMKSKSYYKVSDFNGDYLFAGDVHKQQFFYRS
jgi:DNA repair exonuclease SbcCD nuclease subunit